MSIIIDDNDGGGTTPPTPTTTPTIDPSFPDMDDNLPVNGLPSITTAAQPAPTTAITTTGFDVEYNWLTITPTLPSNPYVHIRTGGYDLVSFENLGAIPQGDSILYTAKGTFEFELTAFQSLGLNNIFPDIVVDDWSDTINYIVVATISLSIPTISISTASVSFNYVDLGQLVSNEFASRIPITVGINPTFSNLNDATIDGIPISMAQYYYEVKSVQQTNVYYGTCGDYNDYYTEAETKGKGITPVATTKDVTPSQQSVIDRINSLNLGWTTGLTPDYLTTYTLQQMEAFASPAGSPTNVGTGDMTFLNDIHLQPGITKTTQRIDFRRAGLIYNNIFNTVTIYGSVLVGSTRRTLSAHVYLPYSHQTFRAEVYFMSDVQLNAQLYKSALQDPFFMKGDWVWSTAARDEGLELPVSPSWWDQYWWVMLLIIGIVGVILVAYIYGKFKRNKIIVNINKGVV